MEPGGSEPRRSAFSRFLAAPFWAGLLGVSFLFWSLGVIIGLDKVGALPRDEGFQKLFAAAVVLAAVWIGVAKGYTAPVRSFGALAGRLLGAIAFALLFGFVFVLVVEKLFTSSA